MATIKAKLRAALKKLDRPFALLRKVAVDLRQRERTTTQDADLDRLTRQALLKVLEAEVVFISDVAKLVPGGEAYMEFDQESDARDKMRRVLDAARSFVGATSDESAPDAHVRAGIDRMEEDASSFVEQVLSFADDEDADSRLGSDAMAWVTFTAENVAVLASHMGWSSAAEAIRKSVTTPVCKICGRWIDEHGGKCIFCDPPEDDE